MQADLPLSLFLYNNKSEISKQKFELKKRNKSNHTHYTLNIDSKLIIKRRKPCILLWYFKYMLFFIQTKENTFFLNLKLKNGKMRKHYNILHKFRINDINKDKKNLSSKQNNHIFIYHTLQSIFFKWFSLRKRKIGCEK